MSVATLIDPHTGKAEGSAVSPILSPAGVPITMEDNYRRGWRGSELGGAKPEFDRLPDSIQEMMAKSRGDIGPFAGMRPPTMDHVSGEVLRYWVTADTTLNTIAELIMVPAFNFSPSEMQVGTCVKMTILGSLSLAITTPGTSTFRMRWGGVGATILAASSGIIPTATQTTTTASFVLEYWVTCRTVGTTGTAWCQGRLECPGILETTPASTTIMVTYFKAMQIPASAAAISPSTFDTTIAAGPSPTFQQTTNTYVCTPHLAFLECMN